VEQYKYLGVILEKIRESLKKFKKLQKMMQWKKAPLYVRMELLKTLAIP
jgi:hypothetical protein